MEKCVHKESHLSFRKAYWFSRMLINGDKYGGVGKDTKLMMQLASGIHAILHDFMSDDSLKVKLSIDLIKKTLVERWRKGKKHERVQHLCEDLQGKIKSVSDCSVFALTCERIMVPIELSLQRIPSNDLQFTQIKATEHLNTYGEEGLATLIKYWDDLGVEGCLETERTEVISLFKEMRTYLETILQKDEIDIVLSGFVQEFERRLGQKRKGRAGGSLEDLTSFILDYFKIPAVHSPEHFTAGIEVDKWVRGSDGWYIGISCKRTLRERWKQAYTSDLNLLNRYKIRNLFHLVTYDEDLSDDKVTEMGSYRVIIYLLDESRRYLEISGHPGMKDYVRPMSKFVDDLKMIRQK